MIEELNEIHKQVVKDQAYVPSDVTTRFWKIVGQIKRTPNPDKETVEKTSEIRDILYSRKFGGTIPLWLAIPIWFLLGVACVYGFVYEIIHNIPAGIEGSQYYVLLWLMGALLFLFPFGRLIAGIFAGIKFDGLAMTHYILPTFKVNYQSYLLTSPPKRQWFFFFAGFWAIIITGVMGIIGYLATDDAIVLLPFIVTGVGELIGTTGIFGKWGGEMNNFHREGKVVQDWRKNMEKITLANS